MAAEPAAASDRTVSGVAHLLVGVYFRVERASALVVRRLSRILLARYPTTMRCLALFFVVASAGACDTAAPSTPLVPTVTVTTDRAAYRSGDAAVFTVHNVSSDTLYASLCDSIIERATGPSWSRHDSIVCGASSPNDNYPIALPGGTAEVELAGHFVRDLAPGTFRLRLSITKAGGTHLPDSTRTSNAFDVTLAGGQ